MITRHRKSQTSFKRNSSVSSNRRKRMRNLQHKKVLWRHRTFTLREFACDEL